MFVQFWKEIYLINNVVKLCNKSAQTSLFERLVLSLHDKLRGKLNRGRHVSGLSRRISSVVLRSNPEIVQAVFMGNDDVFNPLQFLMLVLSILIRYSVLKIGSVNVVFNYY